MKTKIFILPITLLIIALFFGCKKDTFVEVPGVCPEVILTSPVNGATSVVLNKVITATFNEVMNAATITQASFIIMKGTAPATTPVLGIVTYTGTTASFTPSSLLAPNTNYYCTIKTLAKDLNGNALQEDYEWAFSTSTIPTVTSVDPSNLATNVAFNKVISAKFSEPMNAATITAASTFTLKLGSAPITGSVSYTDSTASFTPDVNLLPGNTYMATISTAAKNLAGNSIASIYDWTFTTINQYTVTFNKNGGDTEASPTSKTATSGGNVGTLPTPPIWTGRSFASWNTASNGSGTEFTATTVVTANITVYAKWTANNNTITFDGNTNTGGSTAAQTLASNATANLTINGFTKTGYTFAGWATTAGGAVAYANQASYTMGTANVTLYAKWTANNNTITFDGNTNTGGSTAAQTLASNATANLTINGFTKTGYTFAGWATTAGGAVAYANQASYTMGTANVTLYAKWTAIIVCTPAVDLKTAGDFVILANSGISTKIGTNITGDIGTGPGVTSTAITGFGLSSPPTTYTTSSLVNGKVYAYDYNVPTPTKMNTASNDMVTAYGEANGIAPTVTELGAGTLNGNTLVKGVYKWSSNLLITTDIWLDGGGDNCAQFIFQIAGYLTVANGVTIHLQNGANAKNIFWVVAGSKAELGTTVDFSGNILCKTLISLNTGSTVTGRLLAQTAVTLDVNTIVKLPL